MNEDSIAELVESLVWMGIRQRHGPEAAREYATRCQREQQEHCRVTTGHQIRVERDESPRCELCGSELLQQEAQQ